MIREYPKGAKEILSPHFTSNEFDCRCTDSGCDYTLVDCDLVASLEDLRDRVGRLVVTSGFRCTRHNRAVGGKKGSYHLLGKAADIQGAVSAGTLYFAAESIFAKGGLGRYATFIHVDVRGHRSRWEHL